MGAYARTDRAAIKADVERVFALFPRLKERRRQTAGTLSGGEQQMLAMGRALMSRPRLLLLDEPSMGLAPLMVQKVFETIIAVSQRRRDDPADRAEREARARGERPRLRDGVGRDHARGRSVRAAARSEGARRLSRRSGLTRRRRSPCAGSAFTGNTSPPGPTPAIRPARRRRARYAAYPRRTRCNGTPKRCACGSAVPAVFCAARARRARRQSGARASCRSSACALAQLVLPLLECGLLYAASPPTAVTGRGCAI